MASTAGRIKPIKGLGNNGISRHDEEGDYVTDTNTTMYNDVIIVDLEDEDAGQNEDTITDQITNWKTNLAVVLSTPRSKMPGASRNPGRPFVSPTDTLDPLDSFRFKEIFPKLDLSQEFNNRYGRQNESDAYIIDENITMHGDLLMLDLENIDGECDTDSGQRPSTTQTFTQLIEQIQTPREPTTKRTTTGIRHIMAIRDKHQQEAFSANNVTGQTKARELIHSDNEDDRVEPFSISTTSPREERQETKSSKTKSGGSVKYPGSKKARRQKKHVDNSGSAIKPVNPLLEMDVSGHPSMQLVGDGKRAERTKKSLFERIRQQLNRFRAYIQRKVLKQ